MPLNRSGFSLVELSIVLVILGLLTGGILGGQALIHAAELRTITSDVERYQTAVNTFKQKYFGLPGDLPNATQFWGSVTESGSSCSSDMAGGMGTGTQTCDGNNNGLIASREIHRFWQHLANAGLIAGTYSGVEHNNDADMGDIGSTNGVSNAPTARFGAGTHWTVGSTSLGANSFDLDNGNFLLLTSGTNHFVSRSPMATPEDMWNIDTKIDDGKPAQGKVAAYNFANCTDAANRTDYDADYNLSNDAIACAFVFRTMW